MFSEIPPSMKRRMQELQEIDARDRVDGTPQSHRLRQISPETGKFIAILAASAPAGQFIEIGSSAGYSTMWLALACRAVGRKIKTFEIADNKVELARRTFDEAGVTDVVEIVHGDALAHLANEKEIAFCFLDAEKGMYDLFYESVVSRMVSGGILVADNVISHQATLRAMLDRSLGDDRVDAVIVPIGSGELVCRKK